MGCLYKNMQWGLNLKRQNHTWNWSQHIRNEDFHQSLIKKVITGFDECYYWFIVTQLHKFGLRKSTLILSIITI